MRQYGNGMKATEFSKKQISVIYAMAKKGELKVEKWYMNYLYDLAEYYGHDDNGSVELTERHINRMLEKVLAHDIEGAQKDITWHTEHEYNLFGRKTKANCDRTVFIA